jgi:TRAP-type mannitol/chloroaromatic compound transport system permease large subunit
VCEIGMIFPPVGLNVYIMNALAKTVPMSETYKGVVPFLVTDFISPGAAHRLPGAHAVAGAAAGLTAIPRRRIRNA